MRPTSSETTAKPEPRLSCIQPSWSSSEILLVAAGGAAMLLVVAVLDTLQLIP